MRIVLFCHSLISDWNHGNAHFLRGVTMELIRRGHGVRVYEPRDSWSVENLLNDAGPGAIAGFHEAYPALTSVRADLAHLDLDEALDGADLVVVHEWNAQAVVERIGRHRAAGGQYVLLFHDTHHRSVTEPDAMAGYDLEHYDGVLAFGEVIRQRYESLGWARRAWTWHEAADVTRFRPANTHERGLGGDVVWIGNWGDEERSNEIRQYLIEPVKQLGLRARVHGVRYPAEALQALESAAIEYGGWLPNYQVPEVFARFRATVHIPRQPYVRALPGIPTIRMFEALACGIPLVSCWWDDCERLFRPGRDYLVARSPEEMRRGLRDLIKDGALASYLVRDGLETIRARHTCAHRVDELFTIVRSLDRTRVEKGLSV
jgi:spore maturation protein CgeB